MNENPITVTIPLHITISLGQPGAIGVPTATGLAAPPVAPAVAPHIVEGLFSRQPPTATFDMPYTFDKSSLDSTAFSWKTALSLALASRLAAIGDGGRWPGPNRPPATAAAGGRACAGSAFAAGGGARCAGAAERCAGRAAGADG